MKTNVLGAANVIDAAIDRNVKRVIALSTDKAANPVNLYGATDPHKLCADKLFVAGGAYRAFDASGEHQTRFATVRYGNVVGSRGSVVPLFLKARDTGVVPITDPRMTRFWITLDQGVQFVLDCLERMAGKEIFVPKIPSMNIMDLAEAIAPDCERKVIGIRPGEKLHEVMIPEDDARWTLEHDRYFTILPKSAPSYASSKQRGSGRPCPDGFRYGSDNNGQWLKPEALKSMVRDLEL